MSSTRMADGGSDDNGEDEFRSKEIESNLYQCQEVYYRSCNVANIWIIKGTSRDLIVDTGIGLWDLPTYLRTKYSIGDDGKPFQVVATHVHFDHAGVAHQFPNEFAIHTDEAHAIETGDSYEACCFMSPGECGKPPSKGWKRRDYKLRPVKPARILQDGDVFDLGSRQLRVMHLPGHSRGSIALFDEDNGHLYSGDIVYDSEVLDWMPYGSVEDNIQSFEQLKDLSSQVQLVLPGHGEPFDGTRLNEITTNYLNNVGLCHSCMGQVGKGLATVLLKGRNTNHFPSRCCYFSCCCCICT